MSTEARSKFTAFLNPKATADNKLPNVTGHFALHDGKTCTFVAWANRSAKGTLYMKGMHTAENLAEALKAQIDSGNVNAIGPAEIDLKPGEIILFENLAKQGSSEGETDADREKRLKRPDWYGYARTVDGWFQLAGWSQDAKGKPGFIAGTAALYEMKPSADAAPGADRQTKTRIRKGSSSKPAPQV